MEIKKLSKEQERKITILGNCIFSEAKLFYSHEDPLLVKLPLSTLEEMGISLTQARNLIRGLYMQIGDFDTDIIILNGRIFQYGNSPVEVMLGNSNKEVFGIEARDEEDYLILWIYGLSELEKAFQKRFTYVSDELVSKFDKTLSKIIYGSKEINLPPTKNEFNLCCVMYKYKINEPVDWSDVWNQIEGIKDGSIPEKYNKKRLQDTTDRINKRVNSVLGLKKNLFTWKSKNISRNF